MTGRRAKFASSLLERMSLRMHLKLDEQRAPDYCDNVELYNRPKNSEI